MYRLYRKILGTFQGGFEIFLKKGVFYTNFRSFYCSFPGVSLMMREVSHVCCLKLCLTLIYVIN